MLMKVKIRLVGRRRYPVIRTVFSSSCDSCRSLLLSEKVQKVVVVRSVVAGAEVSKSVTLEATVILMVL